MKFSGFATGFGLGRIKKQKNPPGFDIFVFY